ncbi:MAG: Ig-like domain-containing protein, partial [Eubacterium sp.]|nr:Ig-like domain-containing protein [Eubacterium sp.]
LNFKTAASTETVTSKTSNDTKPYLKLNVKSLKMKKGTSCKGIKATAMVRNDKIKSYSSNKKKVVKVTKKGKLIAKKLGKATITVKTKKGAKAKIKIKVIKGQVKTKKIKLTKKKATLKKGKKVKITYTLNPISATQKVTFTSKKPKIATVTKKGVVKARKKGKAVILVKSGKKKAKFTVKVK